MAGCSCAIASLFTATTSGRRSELEQPLHHAPKSTSGSGKAWAGCSMRSCLRNVFYQQKFAQAGLTRHDIRLPSRPAPPALYDQDRTARRSGEVPALWPAFDVSAGSLRRLHQTSGTRGVPLRCLDTPESWQRLLDCWDDDLRHRRRQGRGPAAVSVFLRPVPGLLDRLRGGRAARLPVPAGRGTEQRRPPAHAARQPGHASC